MATKLIDLTIPTGWTAFCNVAEKKVLGYREFKNAGKAKTALTLITKPSEAQLKTELARLKYTLPA
jgi:hypothetical protein